MRTSVLATVRAFSSQRRRAAGCRAGCRAGSPRARTHPTEIAARIQPDLRIQIVHALSQLDSCTRGWMGGRACDGMDSTARTGRAAQYVRVTSAPRARAHPEAIDLSLRVHLSLRSAGFWFSLKAIGRLVAFWQSSQSSP